LRVQSFELKVLKMDFYSSWECEMGELRIAGKKFEKEFEKFSELGTLRV